MKPHQSALFTIEHRESEKLLLTRWTGKELNAETFMQEMKAYMETLEKTKAEKVIWDHTDFKFHIPDHLFEWIENTVNKPAKGHGMKKVGFIMGEDVMAQISTMESFEATNSVYAPKYFANSSKAMDWINKKQPEIINPFEKEIDLIVEHNAHSETATIQMEVSLEKLPFYLKKLKDLFHDQQFAQKNYRKYMLLTAREKEILNLITKGYTNRQISERLFISLHTMATHRKNILRKLDCRKIPDLIKYNVLLSY
ncbi:MAG: helix-turn-helix transcriptional regulator [Ginsengibacter sp.]